MWESKNKNDLIIEVWEKLDCENVGASEIESIETVVADIFGTAAVDSPMVIARLLADEGAELRHSEIMKLYLERASDRPHDAALRGLVVTSSLTATLRSIREMENLRLKLKSDKDNDGLRRLRQEAIDAKEEKLRIAARPGVSERERLESSEIAEWLRIWLQSPEVFENWIKLRRKSEDFIKKFGEARDK
jgi:hypothetical protein